MSDVEQGSAEWHAMRAGKATASRMADILATIKSGEAASRKNYRAQLVAERLTGIVSMDGYVSAEMKWGTETEPEARDAYAYPRKALLTRVAFVDHPVIAMSGASPDCYVGDVGMIEVKCPNTATHIDTLLGKSIPGKYVHQMHWQMACTGRQWCDFVSYDPRMPEHLRMFVKRLPRDDVAIAALEAEVRKFLAEVDATLSSLNMLEAA